MSSHNDDRIQRLEAHLEQWVEATFAAAFGPRVDVFDLALYIARAMEAGVRREEGEPRPVAPDQYRVTLQRAAYDRLFERQTELVERLSAYITTLAAQNEYKLTRQPKVMLQTDPGYKHHHPAVSTSHTDDPGSSTVGLDAVAFAAVRPANAQAHLMLTGGASYTLASPLTHIGRMEDNDLVVDDPHVSRYHLQIRQRGGEYLLFDAGSSRGTRVNGALVREHRLRTGDVIEIGKTRLIYIEERDEDHQPPPPTDTIDAV